MLPHFQSDGQNDWGSRVQQRSRLVPCESMYTGCRVLSQLDTGGCCADSKGSVRYTGAGLARWLSKKEKSNNVSSMYARAIFPSCFSMMIIRQGNRNVSVDVITVCNIKMTCLRPSFLVGNLRCKLSLTLGKLGAEQDVCELYSYPQTRKELEEYMYIKPRVAITDVDA